MKNRITKNRITKNQVYKVREKKKPSEMMCFGMLCMFLIYTLTLTGCGKDDMVMLSNDIISDVPAASGNGSLESQKGTGSGMDENYHERTIYVFICGAVNNPGVYELDNGARIVDAIIAAGGMYEDAAPYYLNQAAILNDGDKLYVPTKEEIENKIVNSESADVSMAEINFLDTGVGQSPANTAENGLININTAGLSELKSLPGIGDAKARKIIEYREDNGPYSSIEDIMKVQGIKSGMFDKIKDKITVM